LFTLQPLATLAEADNKHTAVCATRPSDNTSRVAESWRIRKSGFQNQHTKFLRKTSKIVTCCLQMKIR